MRPRVDLPPPSPSEYGQAQLVVRTGVIASAVLLTLFFGFWLTKAPCVMRDWDGKQYGSGLTDELDPAERQRYFTLPCYSDILPLWSSDRGGPDGQLIGERIDLGRVPYIQAPNEYPVLTGMLQWFAAVPLPKSTPEQAAPGAPFFYASALLLGAAAVVTTILLGKMVGARALYFALAPTLAIYGLMNWDLLAVLLATAGTYWYLRRDDRWAGTFLGLGAAAKLYPGLLVVPYALGRVREKSRQALRVALYAAGAWIVINLPFALGGFENWKIFFTFNSQRPADWDSIWFLVGGWFDIQWDQTLLNLLSLGVFVALAVTLWTVKSAREPDFPAWSFALPLVIAFLITNKVYSPQYSLWLLPLFALSLPNVRLFMAFELADVAVYYTRFRWFGGLQVEENAPIDEGLPAWAFKAALVIRMAILVAALVAWVLSRSDRRAEDVAPRLVPYPVDA
jgi:uncharacterized membrane protein